MITEFIQNNPRLGIILLSFIVSLFITIVNYFMLDKEKMKEIKERQKSLRAEIKKNKDNPEKIMELNKRMMEDMPEQLKHSFKPMIVTLIPLLILLNYLRATFAETILSEKFLIFPTWIWYYLIASIVFSTILRKLFKLQ